MLYGGAARGGKTWAALMAAAQYVDVPGYSALLLRENFGDLMQPGAFIPESKAWWKGKVSWNGSEKRWTFPSGATITFGYLEGDDAVYQYQGAQYQFICIDELTQHTDWRYRYLFSRLSRPDSGPLSAVPLRMRATANPGGKGHEWVKKRFISLESREPGTVFIPARVEDNYSVDQKAYRESLSFLDPVTRAQLLMGDWDALPSGRFNRETLNRHRYTITHKEFKQGGEYVYGGRRCLCSDCWVFLTVDPAATAEGVRKRGDPDYTVVSVWAVTPDKHLIWVDCHRFRLEIPEIVPQIQSVYQQYRPHFVGIEAVASNRGVLQLAMRTGMVVRELSPRGQDKLVRATPVMVLSESGRMWLPEKAHWLDDAITEFLLFTGDGSTHDDQVDCASYACALMDEFDDGDDSRPMVLSGRRW